MVADAQARTSNRKAVTRNNNVSVVTARDFRGSWSGYERDVYFHNSAGRSPRLYQSAYVLGLDFDDDGRAVAPFDVDGDGDLDLAIQSLQGLRLMENTSPPRRFARLRLVATSTHESALGALVRLTAGGATQQEYVRLTDGYQTQVPLELHFGLGEATRVERIEVTWPGGAKGTWTDLPADRLLTLREGSASPGVAELKAWPAETRPRPVAAFQPGLLAEKLDGGQGALATSGRPAVLNFWSPTCAACKEEMPALAELARTFAEEAQFTGVNTGDREEAKAMAALLAPSYPHVQADDRIVRSFFGADGRIVLPSTFVFDASGKLRRVFRRAVTAAEMRELLASFRGEEIGAQPIEVLASDHFKRGELKEALETIDRALASNPKSAGALHLKGMILIGMQREEEAIAVLRAATEADPGYKDAAYNLAVALHTSGRAKEALPLYAESLDVRGEGYELLLLYGSAAAECGEAKLAMGLFDKAVLLSPGEPRGHVARAKLHMALRDFARARASLELALGLDAANAEAQSWMKKLSELERR